MVMVVMMMMRFVEWQTSRTSIITKKTCRICTITEITWRISNMSRNITEGLVVNYSNPS
jgi:hypothetical protein